MPWQPLPRIAFAVATYPFSPSSPADLPLELGDELYIIEETPDGDWLRGYLVAPPSLLAGLTSVRGQTLETRVFSGIFPRSCVEVREMLGEPDDADADDDRSQDDPSRPADPQLSGSDSAKSGLEAVEKKRRKDRSKGPEISLVSSGDGKAKRGTDPSLANGARGPSPPVRDPNQPRPAAPVPMLKIGDETPTSASEPLIDEIASCLREWHSTNLHELLLSRQYAKLDQLSQLITTLNFSRQQFLHGVLTACEYRNLRERTVWNLVQVNKLCGGEVIVRDPQERGRVLTGDDSVVDVTKLQSVMSLLDQAPTPPVELSALHHLMVEVKGFAGASTDPATIVMYLAGKPAGGSLAPLSETYIIEVPAGGQIGDLSKVLQMRTLFADLTATDIGDAPSIESDMFLVIKICASQQVVASKPASRSGSASQAISSFSSKDTPKPPMSAGNKSMRRSLMWPGKSSRSAFSRGSHKLDALNEQPESRPPTTEGRQESRDGRPPSTANSRTTRTSMDGQGSPAMAERIVGVGVLRVNSVMKQEEEVEHVVNVWSPAARRPSEKADGAEEWDPVLREILDSSSGRYEKSGRAERLQVRLMAFNSPDADALVKATPTVLSGVCKTNRMGFAGAPTRPRSDIYVTVDTAALSRQTLICRHGGSPTSLPSNLHGSNLQVTLEVRRANGERIENCIHASSNTEPVGTWKTVATGRGESWGQTVRLFLAPQDVHGSHVAMYVADAPNPPFAMAYLPLWDRQAFVRDGPHGLLLYRLDENTAVAQANTQGKGGYLGLPWTPKGKDGHRVEVTGPLAILRVETYLCSTRYSQDRAVLGLLRWKDAPRDEIPNLLKQLVFVAEIEVVKLLSDVLDALFGILVEFSGNDDYEDLVFTALVRVLGIVHDRRFNLAPLVDQYAESKFHYPFATPCLVRSFTRLLSRPTEAQTARKLRATFKVVRHILKFITHARGQQVAKEAGIGITGSNSGFARNLRGIFKALDAMMRSDAPALIGSQTLAVQHFHTWLPELTGLLTAEEILHVAIDFMDSCAAVRGKLVLYKLLLIVNYSRLEIFSHPEQRSALSANSVRWIAPHWGATAEVTEQWREQVRLCCSVLAGQVDYLGPEIPDYIPKIVDSYLALLPVEKTARRRLSLLFPTSYPFPSRPVAEEVTIDETLVELSAVLSALSNSPSGMQFELSDDDLGTVVEKTLRVHMSILRAEAFPASWLSVHIFHHKSTMRTLEYLSTILLDSFLPEPEEAEGFSTELWKMFFTTLLQLVGSPSLALETFPEQKRRAVWKIAGDVREHGAELLRRTWEAIGWETSQEERERYGLGRIGGYQVQYVPVLVGPIVELCLSVHEGLRRMAVEVLQTMIVSEWTLSEDLSVIQTEMIDSLDVYFKSKPLTESILQKLFVGELLERFEHVHHRTGDSLYAALRELMGTIDEFLDLLVAVHGSEGAGEVSHLIHRLRLMEFLRDMQKEEIFIRYVHQLADLQAGARNHAEAGLTLRLHADLYEWEPTKAAPPLADPRLPAQSHFERKERIYFEMIKHFEDGQAWASALDAYKELQVQYETNVFDFAKLARTERAIATIYETINKTEAVIPKYFKVAYKGLGFPTGLRDKEFVFEGSPTERTPAFMDRMQEQYPAAQIVTDSRIEDVEGQFLVISSLNPHRDLGHHVFQRARVPQAIRDHVLSSHPQRFTVNTKRNTTGPAAGHYSEKMLYTTAEPFPTILRRSEIVAAQEVRLSTKQTALERIVRKTSEMTAVEKRLADAAGNDEVAQLLVDAVSISLNPHSENSVVRYRNLLPGPEDSGSALDAELEDDAEPIELDAQENAVRMALVDHAIMIKRCLTTFSRSSNPILSRRVEAFQRYFESTFAPEIAFFSPPQPLRDPAATPSPSWPRSPPSTTQASSPRNQTATSLNADSADAEEVSVVRPISLRQGRGARLSFLGGLKKDQAQQKATAQAGASGAGDHRRNRSGNHSAGHHLSTEGHLPLPLTPSSQASNRRSFFRPHAGDHVANGSIADEATKQPAVVDVLGAEASDLASSPVGNGEHNGGGGPGRGNVKKRLSLLKLGKKSSKGNVLLMGSVEEE